MDVLARLSEFRFFQVFTWDCESSHWHFLIKHSCPIICEKDFRFNCIASIEMISTSTCERLRFLCRRIGMKESRCVSSAQACVCLVVLISIIVVFPGSSGSAGRPILVPANSHMGNCSTHTSMHRADIGSRLMLLPSTDGFGSHVHALLSALAYCRAMNLTYVHRQWAQVGHRPPGKSHEQWSRSLENFTGLVEDEIRFTDNLGPVPAVRWISADTDMYFNSQFLALMRDRYLIALPPKTTSEIFAASRGDVVRVAVHIRRGDVGTSSVGNSRISRYTNNTQVLAYMHHVDRDIRSNDNYKDAIFHIYSEGHPGEFDDLIRAYKVRRVFLHLGGDIKTSFHEMVSADVFIMAKSSFSYAAALLSGGIVYHQPFWHEGLSRWRVLPKI